MAPIIASGRFLCQMVMTSARVDFAPSCLHEIRAVPIVAYYEGAAFQSGAGWRARACHRLWGIGEKRVNVDDLGKVVSCELGLWCCPLNPKSKLRLGSLLPQSFALPRTVHRRVAKVDWYRLAFASLRLASYLYDPRSSVASLLLVSSFRLLSALDLHDLSPSLV